MYLNIQGTSADPNYTLMIFQNNIVLCVRKGIISRQSCTVIKRIEINSNNCYLHAITIHEYIYLFIYNFNDECLNKINLLILTNYWKRYSVLIRVPLRKFCIFKNVFFSRSLVLKPY